MAPRGKRLRRDFPFRDVFSAAISDYRRCPTYWYVPKARSLNDENVLFCAQVLRTIFEDFFGETWDGETQGRILSRLAKQDLVDPAGDGTPIKDRNALIRIINTFLGTLGLLWAEADQEIIITDAGVALVAAVERKTDPRFAVERQIAKMQYPHPLLPSRYREAFGELVPHIFLMQVLKDTNEYLTFEEYELFVNLATEQGDVSRIVRYVQHWRNLDETARDELRAIFRTTPTITVPVNGGRFNRIHLNASYQRSFFCYPSWVELDSNSRTIRIHERGRIEELIRSDLKVTEFASREDWFAYFGDPEQHPSWSTYLTFAVETAQSREQVEEEIEEHTDKLSEEESVEIKRRQLEKAIESSYAEHPELLTGLEAGLRLLDRQVKTPIGRIDLLCRGSDEEYVVIEIKAKSAEDAVFGQILRYIGWVHSNYDDGRDNVRGIILASQFSDKARYSRIGLLKPDADQFLRFHQHAFAGSEV